MRREWLPVALLGLALGVGGCARAGSGRQPSGLTGPGPEERPIPVGSAAPLVTTAVEGAPDPLALVSARTPSFGTSPLFPALPAGDARLEPLPPGSFTIEDSLAWFKGATVRVRFFPRPSVGEGRSMDHHADLFVFVRGSDGIPLPQPFLLEAVPKGAAGPDVPVPDEVARAFSARWEVHVLRMADDYDPRDPAKVMDSTTKLTSPEVLEDIQTNLYLDCPVIPPGATIAADESVVHSATWNGHEVRIATYEVDDAPQAPIPLYVFEDPAGRFVGRPVVVRIPGQENYSSLWDVRAVSVGAGYVPDSIRSHQEVVASGLPVRSLGFQVNCPVIAIPGTDGRLVPVHHDSVLSLLLGPDGKFSDLLFPREVRGVPFTADRVFRLVQRGLSVDDPNHNFVQTATAGPGFVLATPVLPAEFRLEELIHDSSGKLLHLRQEDLDQGRLTAPIDSNVKAFLPADAPFVQKVALVGRALFEHPYTKEEGGGPVLNRMSCASCHGQVATGGGGPASFSVVQAPGPSTFGEIPAPDDAARALRIDPAVLFFQRPGILRRAPHVFGAGLKEQLARERSSDATGAHAWKRKGSVPSLRAFTAGALEGELGIEAVEKIAADRGVSIDEARRLDPDGDGVVEEATVGDVTALVAFQASLPAPTRLPALGLQLRGEVVGPDLLTAGERLFRESIAQGGAGCASCHTPASSLRSTTLALENPLTPGVLSIPLPVGSQEGSVATYSDMKRHKMGPLVSDAVPQEGVAADVFLTKELWGLGSSPPYLHDGSAGGDVAAAVLAHRGTLAPGRIQVSVGGQVVVDAASVGSAIEVRALATSSPWITYRRPERGGVTLPLRIVITRMVTPGASVTNADAGGTGEGASFLVGSLDGLGQATVYPTFSLPPGSSLSFDVAVAEERGYSEALSSTEAWLRLDEPSRASIVRFLRSLRLPGDLADDRGFEVESP